jgi:hypothetical protein
MSSRWYATEMRRGTITQSVPERPGSDVQITFDDGCATLPREGNLVCSALWQSVFDPAERVRVTAVPVCSGAAPETSRGAVVLEDGGIAGLGGCRLHPQLAGRDRPQRLHAIHHGGSVSADYCEWLTALIRDIERGKIKFRRSGPHDVRGGCALRYANGRFSANLT